MRVTSQSLKRTLNHFVQLHYRSTSGPRPQSGSPQVTTLRIKSESGEMVSQPT